jgi:flagellar hook assembly protein FlgD
VTADDADNLDAVYGNDDTITFVFSENTNEPFGPNPAQANLDTLFGAMNLGTMYSGTWTNAQTLTITITNATGGTEPTIGATTYTLQAAGNLKNAAGTSFASTDTSPAITGDWGSPAPQITGAVLESENRFVDITFDRVVYDTGAGTGAVKPSDLTLIFNQNGGNTTTVSISSMTKTNNSALVGGELVVRAHLTIDGTPVGVETIEIRPATNEIFSVASAAALNTETTGVMTLNSQMVPVDYGKVIIRSNVINPSKGEYTALNFRLNKSTKVNITVYDLAGNPVKELYDRTAPAGLTEVRWYGKNKRGRKVVPGLYYIVTKIGKSRDVKKVLVVK